MLFNTPDNASFMQVSVPVILTVAGALVAFFVFIFGAVARSRRRKVVTGREGLIGRVATVRGRLAPEGYVHVEGELWKARSSGRAVEVGEKVRVLDVDGLSLAVAPETAEPPRAEAPEPAP